MQLSRHKQRARRRIPRRLNLSSHRERAREYAQLVAAHLDLLRRWVRHGPCLDGARIPRQPEWNQELILWLIAVYVIPGKRAYIDGRRRRAASLHNYL